MQQLSCHNRLNIQATVPVCTVLLNPGLRKIFYENARLRRVSASHYVASLLAYGELLVNEIKSLNEGPLTKYQERAQGLQRLNVRVCWNHWVQFTILARGLGVSNCLLVAYLIALDSERIKSAGRDMGVPTLQIWNGNPRFLESLTGRHRVFAFS